jgi:hypothetical protein
MLYTKNGELSPYSLEEWKEFSKQRADIISQNRSRNMRGMPALPVPQKLDRPCKAIAYEVDGTYWGALDRVEDAPKGAIIKFEPAL